MRVVSDTNNIVSRYPVAAGIPAQIMAAWRAGRFDLVVSPALLAEYERVLNYERLRRRHGLTSEQIAREIAALRDAAIFVEPIAVPAVIADDPSDDHVLACAVAGDADFIVSGDRHLVDLREYQGIRISRPAAFLALLQDSQ